MNIHSTVLLDFQREDARMQLESARRDLKSALRGLDSEEAARRIIDIGSCLDTGVARAKRDLLGSALCWTDDNQALMSWIERQHHGLVELGEELTFAMARDGSPMLIAMIASSLHHWGEAIKWSPGRDRTDLGPLHLLFTRAQVLGRHREAFICKVDGGGKRTCVEALYFRALLLDRFGGGNLTAAQMEVLDAWLWQWGDALRGESVAPEGLHMRVDLDSRSGLREGPREATGPSLYLALVPLENARRAIVKELHRGNLVPAQGCSAELRIEEHIAVLDRLAKAFSAPEADAAPRAPRQQGDRARTEVWVGLQEILTRGIGVGIETGRFRALKLVHDSMEEQARHRFDDASKRYFWLSDESASGLGFEALESDAAGIEVGALLGWRRIAGGPVIIGRVTRRVARMAGAEVFFGIHLLSECAQPLKLAPAVASRPEEDVYLFVPGEDASGRHDAFLVPEGDFERHAAYGVAIGEQSFNLRFNRVRMKGRGWVLAGFELMDTPAAQTAIVDEVPSGSGARPPAARPPLELQLEDPWSLEVRPKLLN
jgi:hypothetical protein